MIAGHLVVVVVGFVCATALTFTGKLDSSAYTALVGMLLGLIGGGAVTGAGAAVGASSPHQADAVVATAANPIPGGRRSYDPSPPHPASTPGEP